MNGDNKPMNAIRNESYPSIQTEMNPEMNPDMSRTLVRNATDKLGNTQKTIIKELINIDKGKIRVQDLLDAVEKHQKLDKKYVLSKYRIRMLIGVIILILIINALLTLAVVNLAKDVDTDDNNLMIVRGGEDDKSNDEKILNIPAVVGLRSATFERKMSYEQSLYLSDTALNKLSKIKITFENIVESFDVIGYSRFNQTEEPKNVIIYWVNPRRSLIDINQEVIAVVQTSDVQNLFLHSTDEIQNFLNGNSTSDVQNFLNGTSRRLDRRSTLDEGYGTSRRSTKRVGAKCVPTLREEDDECGKGKRCTKCISQCKGVYTCQSLKTIMTGKYGG